MKKLSLAVIGMFAGLLAAFSQKADSAYKSRRLSFEEANFITSYYRQDGDNSAVTGGIGTEKLTDFSNNFSIRWARYDRKKRKHILDAETGIDYYTSASSDKINPFTISSPSHADLRVYPSVTLTRQDEQNGSTVGAGLSSSFESDYLSIGANIFASQKTRDKSGELTAKLQVYFDRVELIYPYELRTGALRTRDGEPTTPRNTYALSLTWSQVVNENFQLAVVGDIVYQQGLLGLPFHRIFFNDGSEWIENLPGKRFKVPLGLRMSYFLGDHVIIRNYYRFYHDNWGLTAHTIILEVPVKLTPFISVSPFYRLYIQSAVDYFAPYGVHKKKEEFYTSNYDLSKFDSHFFGSSLRLSPPGGILGMKHLATLETRYGHYTKTTGMQSDILSLHLSFR